MDNKDKESKQVQEKISICDIMKEDTSQVIRKLESQIPSFVQNYSDIYATYLHMYDDFFGTCYLAEKEYFDKLGIDQDTLKEVKKSSETIKKIYLENIDMSTKFFDSYAKMRVSATKSFDNYIHTVMDSYHKSFLQFAKMNPYY